MSCHEQMRGNRGVSRIGGGATYLSAFTAAEYPTGMCSKVSNCISHIGVWD